jgi:hypothetical protein
LRAVATRPTWLYEAAGAGSVVDRTGKPLGFLEKTQTDAVLVRPDFYIYGTAARGVSADRLVESLHSNLTRWGLQKKAAEAQFAPA